MKKAVRLRYSVHRGGKKKITNSDSLHSTKAQKTHRGLPGSIFYAQRATIYFLFHNSTHSKNQIRVTMSCAHPLAGNQTLMHCTTLTRKKHHSVPMANILHISKMIYSLRRMKKVSTEPNTGCKLQDYLDVNFSHLSHSKVVPI